MGYKIYENFLRFTIRDRNDKYVFERHVSGRLPARKERDKN
jgi:hypothetical protein